MGEYLEGGLNYTPPLYLILSYGRPHNYTATSTRNNRNYSLGGSDFNI